MRNLKKTFYPLLFLIILITSCQKDESFIPKLEVKLEIIDNGDGNYFLDASASEGADEIQWVIPGLIETSIWEEFESASLKDITVPDSTLDYIVTVKIRGSEGEKTISDTLSGKPPEIKYSNFENLQEMLANPYIADAIFANEMELHTGDNPIDLTGTYEVLRKENHFVNIDGVTSEFVEEDWMDYGCGGNWRSFLCEISSTEILSSYLSGRLSRRISYGLEGSENRFTIFFQSEINPWFTKLDGEKISGESDYYYDQIGTEIPEGVHIVTGEKFEDGSIELNCLWVRVWENEDVSGTGNWSYNEFYIEPEKSDYETFTDPRDGRVYKIVTIGNQTWFAENLKYEPEGDGYQKWPEGTDNDGDDKFYTWSDESETSKELGGIAYTWTAATGYHVDSLVPIGENVQGICPEGWHIPTEEEWNELVDYLGKEVAGTKLQSRVGHLPEVETIYGYHIMPTNETGFNFALSVYVNGMYYEGMLNPGEGILSSGEILTIGNSGEPNYALVGIFDGSAEYSAPIPGGSNWDGKYGGFVIRCVKDSE